MSSTFTPENAAARIDHAADKMDALLSDSQRAADSAISSLRSKVGDFKASARDTLGKAADVAVDLKREGLDRADHLRTETVRRARRMGDSTVDYIRHEPVKSMLIAGAIGAGLALLLSRRQY